MPATYQASRVKSFGLKWMDLDHLSADWRKEILPFSCAYLWFLCLIRCHYSILWSVAGLCKPMGLLKHAITSQPCFGVAAPAVLDHFSSASVVFGNYTQEEFIDVSLL